MGVDEVIGEKRGEVLRLAALHGAGNVRVFGSVARGEAGPESDLDLLVEMEEGRTLLDRAGLLAELTDLLGRRVEVINEKALYPRLRRRILDEARAL